jgi:hypothetical protein
VPRIDDAHAGTHSNHIAARFDPDNIDFDDIMRKVETK